MERKSTDCWWKPCDLLMIRRWWRVVMLWLQRIIGALDKTSNDYGMKINFKKTKSASPVYQTSSASWEWQAPALCCSLTDKEISLRPAVQCKSPHHSRRLQRRTIDDFADLRDIWNTIVPAFASRWIRIMCFKPALISLIVVRNVHEMNLHLHPIRETREFFYIKF